MDNSLLRLTCSPINFMKYMSDFYNRLKSGPHFRNTWSWNGSYFEPVTVYRFPWQTLPRTNNGCSLNDVKHATADCRLGWQTHKASGREKSMCTSTTNKCVRRWGWHRCVRRSGLTQQTGCGRGEVPTCQSVPGPPDSKIDLVKSMRQNQWRRWKQERRVVGFKRWINYDD